jgi:alcohol dehydrogenase class IV
MTGVHRPRRGRTGRYAARAPARRDHRPGAQRIPAGRCLAAGSANALAHATVGLLSDRPTRIGRVLALGALLAGWAVDHSGARPHHALAQTAVRIARLGHADANAALLPAPSAR